MAKSALKEKPLSESFAALLEETLGASSGLEGSVLKGTVVGIENEFVLVDVGLKSEGRVALKEFAAPGDKRRDQGRRHRRSLSRAHGRQARRSHAVAREGPPRGSLDPAREGVQGQPARHRRDLRPREGRLHRRSRRRRRVPARQPGRHPPGARRRPADGHAAAVPDPQDGSRAAATSWCRAAPCSRRPAPKQRNELVARPEGRPGPRRRGEEHHRLRRVRRSRRRRWPAARHRHRVAPHQPSARSAARSARP